MRVLLSTILALAIHFGFAVAATAQPADTVWVTVDGHRTRLIVSGNGATTVVLEAGASSTHRTWTALQDSLARFTRVVSYDRAGLGASDSCLRVRTARVIAEELHEALGKAGLQPPYVLVGWSLGGAFARVFAAMYSAEVNGVVLVDPVQEDFYARAEREHPEAFAEADKADVSRMNAGPQGERAELAAFDSSLNDARAANATLRAPVILLSSARTDLGAIGAIWSDEQRKWARRQRAKFVMVEGAGHAIHRQRPDAVITALRELLPASPRERE